MVFYRYGTAEQGADGPPPQRIDLRVQATIDPDYRIEPSELDFGDIAAFGPRYLRRTLRVTPVSVSSIAISNLEVSATWAVARVLPLGDATGGHEIEVVVDVAALKQSRLLSSTLLIATDSPRAPRAAVKLRGNFLAAVDAYPDIVLVGSDETGIATRQIRLRCCYPARIRRASLSIPDATCSYGAGVIGSEHLLQVVVPESCHALTGELTLDLELFHPDETILPVPLKIPIYRFCPEKPTAAGTGYSSG